MRKIVSVLLTMAVVISLLLIPVVVGANDAPTIDGVLSPGEWDDYFWFEDTDIPSFQAYVTGDDDYLYIAISSSGLAYGDMLFVTIDANHNHQLDADGTDFYLGAVVGYAPDKQYYYRSGVGKWDKRYSEMIAQGFLIVPTDSQAEFRIPKDQLLSDPVGFQLAVWDRDMPSPPQPTDRGNRYPGEDVNTNMAHPNYGDLALVKVEKVNIDIKPGSYPNSINLKSKGVVPVAVLSTDDFDARTVDPNIVVFAGAEPVRWAMEDVDGDGDMDMLFHFKTQELDLDEDSTEATLSGETVDGIPIEGTDTVNIVPKGKK